MFFADMFEIKI